MMMKYCKLQCFYMMKLSIDSQSYAETISHFLKMQYSLVHIV